MSGHYAEERGEGDVAELLLRVPPDGEGCIACSAQATSYGVRYPEDPDGEPVAYALCDACAAPERVPEVHAALDEALRKLAN